MIVQYLDSESVEEIQAQMLAEVYARSDPRLERVVIFEPYECFSLKPNPRPEVIPTNPNLHFVRDLEAFEKYRKDNDVGIVEIKRGGGLMWHGPGQIMLQAIINIEKRRMNVSDYRERLEEILIATLRAFGLEGVRNHYTHGSQGIWVQDQSTQSMKKIGFLGSRLERGVIVGGCALNVSPDLYPFSLIWPCNLEGVEATSLEKMTGENLSVVHVGEVLANNFINIFGDIIQKKKDK